MKNIPPYNTPITIEGFYNRLHAGVGTDYSYIMKPVTFGPIEGHPEYAVEVFGFQTVFVFQTLKQIVESSLALVRPEAHSRGKLRALSFPSSKPVSSTRSIWRKAKHYREVGRTGMQYRYFSCLFAEFYTIDPHDRSKAIHHFGPIEWLEGATQTSPECPVVAAIQCWAERLPYSSVLPPDELAQAMSEVRGYNERHPGAPYVLVRFNLEGRGNFASDMGGYDSLEEAMAVMSIKFLGNGTLPYRAGLIWRPDNDLTCGVIEYEFRYKDNHA